MIAALTGMMTALLFVVLFHQYYFERGLIPPIDRVYAATIRSGIDPTVARSLIFWAIPGALLQLIGGSSRQLGVLFSTGLLLVNPAAGWVILAGLAARIYLRRRYGDAFAPTLSIFGAGCIAGNALADFAGSLLTTGRSGK